MSEKILQAVLMRRALVELQHQIALPNDTSFYSWESDLITINKSGYVNEFECKISRADYLRDAKKPKFRLFERLVRTNRIPNYFWYATLDFDIEPPEFAGWLKVTYNQKRFPYEVRVIKSAPLLHKEKPRERNIRITSRLLSFKLMKFYNIYYKAIEVEKNT